MKKPKKRYTTEKQLLDAIDECHRQGKALLIEADTFEEHGNKEQAKRLRKRATTKLEKRGPALGQKLSEFRTILLPNTGVTDPSVVL